jgi:hypothetical protein
LRLCLVRLISGLADYGVDDKVIESLCEGLTGTYVPEDELRWSPGRTGWPLPSDTPNSHTARPVKLAQLQLACSYLVLQDQELKVERFLGLQYRRLASSYEQIRANRAQRQAFEQQLRLRQEQYLAGRSTLDILLESQRFWADALSEEQRALCTYANAQIGFAFGRGDILRHPSVRPAAELASGNSREEQVAQLAKRTQAKLLGEPALAVVDLVLQAPKGDLAAAGNGPTLPALWKGVPPLKVARPLPPDSPGSASRDPALTPYSATDLFPHCPW